MRKSTTETRRAVAPLLVDWGFITPSPPECSSRLFASALLAVKVTPCITGRTGVVIRTVGAAAT